MGRQIEITVVEYRVTATADLLEDLAPSTCEYIWESLPIEGLCFHAQQTGPMIFTFLPPWHKGPIQEYPSIYPIPGDVCFYYYPPNYFQIPKLWYTVGRVPSMKKGIFEVAVYYGRPAVPLGPAGPVPGNRFAILTDNFENFAAVCPRVIAEGCKTLRITRGR